jgi:hypothetical protein
MALELVSDRGIIPHKKKPVWVTPAFKYHGGECSSVFQNSHTQFRNEGLHSKLKKYSKFSLGGFRFWF